MIIRPREVSGPSPVLISATLYDLYQSYKNWEGVWGGGGRYGWKFFLERNTNELLLFCLHPENGVSFRDV